MNTFAIAEPALSGYINERLPKERIDFLVAQANEQIAEISQNKEIYHSFLKQVDAPEKIDNLVLWILLMSNEEICSEYISEFDKDFEDEIPVFDLSDLLFYTVYLTKVKKIELDGFDYLLEYKDEGIDEIDQCSFTNAFLYIQKSKEVKIDF
jgi:hypothetical protein